MREAHHHKVGQITTAHVVTLIDQPYDPIIVFQKHRFFTKLDFKGALSHLQGEGNARGGIPEPIHDRVPSEVERQVSLIDPPNVPELSGRFGERLQGFKVQPLLTLHCHGYRQQQAILKRARAAQGVVDQEAGKPAIPIHERVVQDEPKGNDASCDHRVNPSRRLMCKRQQLIHQLAAEIR
ncbi:hypothetical protein D3C84_567040 [compost metagenome]